MFADLVRYREHRDAERAQGLAALVALSEEPGCTRRKMKTSPMEPARGNILATT